MHAEFERWRPIVPSERQRIDTALKAGDLKAYLEGDACGWGVMARGVEAYQNTFSKVFPFSFREFLTERSVRNESTSILDFMGFGVVFYEAIEKNIPFSHGVSISLNRWGDMSEQLMNDDHSVLHLRGNILKEKTWENLDDTIRSGSIPRFGLIIWAPSGGNAPEFITESVHVYQEILTRLWSRLSKQNGTLLAEVPYHIIDNHPTQYDKWKRKLLDWQNQHAYIRRGLYQFNDTERVMRLEKTPLNPQLPALTG